MAAIMAVALPAVGILMGGIYFFPLERITKGREPWLTILLLLALGVTIFTVGILTAVPVSHLVMIGGFAVVLALLYGRLQDSLGRSIEVFGVVHLIVLILVGAVAMSHFVDGQRALKRSKSMEGSPPQIVLPDGVR